MSRRVFRTLVAKQRLSDGDACGAFFELTPRAARIAPLADMAPLRTRVIRDIPNPNPQMRKLAKYVAWSWELEIGS